MECPHCHAFQLEPRISQSTFCKKCGAHFKINKGRGLVSPEAQRLKGLAESVGGAPLPLPSVEAFAPREPSRPAERGLPINLPPAEPSSPPVVKEPTAPLSKTSLVRVSPSAQFSQRHRPKVVRCFSCDAETEVTYAAKVAICRSCSAEIDLNDHVINRETEGDIFTRGSITINKLGALRCEKVICQNLKAYGRLEAALECAGDVMIRTTARITGGLQCQKLILGQEAKVEVSGDVEASEMEIGGHITADAFHCTGQVVITEHGSINGPLRTRSVSMEDGGCLNGTLQIVSGPKK